MDCPVCKVPLIAVERNKIEVDYCIICNGIWFDEEEIALFTDETLEFSKVESQEETYNCPRCRQKMEKVCFRETSEPVIDKCINNHGLWFDKKEFGDFMNNLSTPDSNIELPVINFLGEIFYSKK